MAELIHLANFNSTNIGNGALISGTERVLREDWNGPVHFIQEPWDDYTFELKHFDSDFVTMVNRADGLIIGGAVTFNGRDYLKNAGMRFDLPYELWSTLSRPIVFYGVSYRVWPGQPYHHLDELRRAMDYILESRHIMFAVRNDGTKHWLEALLGYTSDRIDVVPDPGLYVPAADAWHPELAEDKVNVLVSLNNEDESQRFRSVQPRWQEHKTRCLRELAQALEMLSRDRDLNIILCPHYFDDYKIMSEFISLFPPRLAHQKTVSTGLQKVRRASYFYDLYAKADLTISMRVHSMSPAIGLGTPMVALSTQPRMEEFMLEAGLTDFLIDFFSGDLGDRIYAKVSEVLKDAGQVRRRFNDVCRAMRAQTLKYNQRIAAMMTRCE